MPLDPLDFAHTIPVVILLTLVVFSTMVNCFTYQFTKRSVKVDFKLPLFWRRPLPTVIDWVYKNREAFRTLSQQ